MIIERSIDEWDAYVTQAASLQGYELDAAQRERVAAQMALVAQVAQPLLALQLAVEVEAAPLFAPSAHA